MTVDDMFNELETALEDGLITGETVIKFAAQRDNPVELEVDPGIVMVGNKVYLIERGKRTVLPEDAKNEIGWGNK